MQVHLQSHNVNVGTTTIPDDNSANLNDLKAKHGVVPAGSKTSRKKHDGPDISGALPAGQSFGSHNDKPND